MARPSRLALIRMLEKMEPSLARAFLKAFADVRNQAAVGAIADLLQRGRVDAAADALGINAARFNELSEQIRSVYAAGGQEGVDELPILRSAVIGGRSARVFINFDLRNLRAERWLTENSSRLITEIVADQRETIRSVLTFGLQLGQNPRTTALDLIGRMGDSGRRTGGIVGLTSQQASFVNNTRAELLSGAPAQMQRYLGRVRRDKRFDGIVKRAIEAGVPLKRGVVDRIAGRYADRLLQLRGETIARTETMQAFAEAREEAFRQAVDTGAISADNVRKTWDAVMDKRTRDAHSELNGMQVGLAQAFESPTGARLLHPGDASLGAGAEDIINCRCIAQYRVDHVAEVLRVQ